MVAEFDLVICGAGLAGLTLARQIKLKSPERRILMLDRIASPLPEATFKVGEATTEVASHYLGHVLGLANYLEERHYRKLGLRLFFGPADKPLAERSEAGVEKFTLPYAYSLDRGRFEEDLRQMCVEMGVEFADGASVRDIHLAENGQDHHSVHYRDAGRTVEVKARWLVDAMGRRRFIQRKLGIEQPIDQTYNSVWFRISGRVDVSDMVPPENEIWHNRVPDGARYYSTNHFVGKGYWIWIIALASGYTSVGIVTDSRVHDLQQIKTIDGTRAWLAEYEPGFADYIGDVDFSDFKLLAGYSYTAETVFSENRWACTGEAGVFTDPLYGTGTDLIGFNNTIIATLMEEDAQGRLDTRQVEDLNKFYINYANGLMNNIQGLYGCFESGTVTSFKVLWDTLSGWIFNAPLMVYDTYLTVEDRREIRKATGRFYFLAHRLQRLFTYWAEHGGGYVTFDYFNFFSLPYFRNIRRRSFELGKTREMLIAEQAEGVAFFEKLTQVIFLYAVADTNPDKLKELPTPYWINAWSVDLDPAKWKKGKLFSPQSPPQDLTELMGPLHEIFSCENADLAKFFGTVNAK